MVRKFVCMSKWALEQQLKPQKPTTRYAWKWIQHQWRKYSLFLSKVMFLNISKLVVEFITIWWLWGNFVCMQAAPVLLFIPLCSSYPSQLCLAWIINRLPYFHHFLPLPYPPRFHSYVYGVSSFSFFFILIARLKSRKYKQALRRKKITWIEKFWIIFFFPPFCDG